jgi:hypothetical protein
VGARSLTPPVRGVLDQVHDFPVLEPCEWYGVESLCMGSILAGSIVALDPLRPWDSLDWADKCWSSAPGTGGSFVASA